jgi:hypothetical protein
MKYFYDCEFIEDGKTIDLISIGIVAEDGREFYAQNLHCKFDLASDWVKTNVFPSLTRFDLKALKPIINADQEGGYGNWYSKGSIASVLSATLIPGFVRMDDGKPEFWGYYSSYDHVALCQLFGTMMDLPNDWPMYTRDLRQWADSLGITEDLDKIIPAEGEHHALADARWNKKAWEYLQSL